MDKTQQIKADLEAYRAQKGGGNTSFGAPSASGAMGGATRDIRSDLENYRKQKQPVQEQPKESGFFGDSALGKVGNFLTSSTQKFGKTIGDALYAPKAASMYAESETQRSDIERKLVESIQKQRLAGEDTSRLERALEQSRQSASGVEDFTGDVINKTAGQVIGEGVGTGLEALSGGLLSGGAKTIGSKTLSTGQKVLQSAGSGAGYGAIAGGASAMQEGGGVLDTAQGALTGGLIGGGLGGGLGIVGAGISNLPKLVPKSENIMSRIAKTTPSAQAKFEKLAGENQGQYLTKRGIFGDEESVMKQLYDRFSKSKSEADTALSGLSGRFKPQPLKSALDDLFEREIRVSAPGAPSSDLQRVTELRNKFDGAGLNMSEINEAKRIYERNVKLDFLKSQNTEGVARANNIDNAVRKWQFEQAEKLGLKNLPELNKETQLARQLLNDMGKKAAGADGKSAFDLSDIVLLSGGDPSAIAMFTTKKLLSNKKLQGQVAKLFAPNKISEPSAQFGGKTDLPALIPGRDYSAAIEARAPRTTTPTTFEAPAQQINRSSSLPEQLRLPAGNRNVNPGQTIVPTPPAKFISEAPAQSAKNFTINPKTGQMEIVTNSKKSKQLSPKQLEKQSQQSYTDTLPPKPSKINTQGGFISTGNKLPTLDATTNKLVSEAKKYKSAEEFVKAQPNIAEYSPLDDKLTKRSIEMLKKVGMDVKSGDEILTLYHGTNAKGVKGITESGSLNPFSYLATDKNASKNFVFGKGGDILEIKVPVKDAGFVLTPMANAKGATIQNPVKLIKGKDGIYRAEQWKTKSQLTDIWNKANKKGNQQGSTLINPLTLGAAATAGVAGATNLGAIASNKLSEKFNTTTVVNESPLIKQTKKANPAELIKAIKYNETRGEKSPYTFRQPSGIKKYGDALGAYQIIEAELDTYGKRFLGKKVTADEFMKSKPLQDLYVANKVKYLSEKGLTPEEILAVHRGGMSDLTKEGLNKKIKQYAGYVDSGISQYNN
jgi:hypothetical protein